MSLTDSLANEEYTQLQKPSFIKKIDPDLAEGSAYWLIEQLISLSEECSADTLDGIYSGLEESWIELTEIDAEEEISNYDRGASYSPVLSGITDRFDYREGIPSGFIMVGDNIELEDTEYLKGIICQEYDDLYPGILERFNHLREFTDWTWKCNSSWGEVYEVTEADVALTVAIATLGEYLRSIATKTMIEQTGYLAYELDLAHQAHFLAYQLRLVESHRAELSQLRFSVSQQQERKLKQQLKNRASRGGKAKAETFKPLKEYIHREYFSREHIFKSMRQASKILSVELSDYARQNNLIPLSVDNSERTIYDWIRRAVRSKN